jgi:hypothetical protein
MSFLALSMMGATAHEGTAGQAAKTTLETLLQPCA